MKYDLYRAAGVDERDDSHIASLTDVDIVKRSHVMRRPGLAELVNGTLSFKTDDAVDGKISAHHAYFLVCENGDRFDFEVSQIGPPVKFVNGNYVISIH